MSAVTYTPREYPKPEMTKSAIAILTFNRRKVLQKMMEGALDHIPADVPIGIFDDLSQNDDTIWWATGGEGTRPCFSLKEIDADAYKYVHTERPNVTVFAGNHNLGVSGNSNRALWWLMNQTQADHFCLCNDDLEVLGDFTAYYRQAHMDLNVGMFCFCDFEDSPTHRWSTVMSRGYKVKLLPRLTGIMMSFPRLLVKEIGFFDVRFGKFGEEHVDYSYRARFAGYSKLDGTDVNGVDVYAPDPANPLLRSQVVETSVKGSYRQHCDMEAAHAIQEASQRYGSEHYYRPFAMRLPKLAGGYRGGGSDTDKLLKAGYALVDEQYGTVIDPTKVEPVKE